MKIENKVKQTLKKIKINKKEKIIVALSGGKDSAVIAFLLKKLGYNIEAIHLNLKTGKYSEDCLKAVKELCEDLNIKLHVYDVKKEIGKSMIEIFKENSHKNLSNCTMCGVFKKWIMNKKARELKASKIATGHHREDELQTFLMNIFKGSPHLSSGFEPMLKNKDKKFVVKIKPLFFVPEKEIEDYAKKNRLPVVKNICPYRKETYRVETRKFFEMISEKEKQNMMKNFLEIFKRIKEDKTQINYCEICGEPSRNKICKKCELMKIKK